MVISALHYRFIALRVTHLAYRLQKNPTCTTSSFESFIWNMLHYIHVHDIVDACTLYTNKIDLACCTNLKNNTVTVFQDG